MLGWPSILLFCHWYMRVVALSVSLAHPKPIKDIGLSVLKYPAVTLYVGDNPFQ
jgi:hypothetical protein